MAAPTSHPRGGPMRFLLTPVLASLILLAGAASAAEEAQVRDLVAKLTGPDNTARRQAAQELGELGTEAKSALPALRKALADKDLFVRRFAALALGKVGPGDKETITSLWKATNDEKKEVQL